MSPRQWIAVLAALGILAGGCTAADSPASATAVSPSAGVATANTAEPTAPPATGAPESTPELGGEPTGPTQTGVVDHIVDGDTIKVTLGGTIVTVRYIGIDTPETVAIGQPIEWMGPEAAAANKALVAEQTVVLEKDVSEVDRYGRLLRYVWLRRAGGWLLVNRELVRLGFANASSYPPDIRYQDLFRAAEAEARDADRGLWGATPPPSQFPTKPTYTQPPVSDCDPAYPTVCIPPPPPDLDCGDITERRFTVLAPDPHHFDGDHDGVGCES